MLLHLRAGMPDRLQAAFQQVFITHLLHCMNYSEEGIVILVARIPALFSSRLTLCLMGCDNYEGDKSYSNVYSTCTSALKNLFKHAESLPLTGCGDKHEEDNGPLNKSPALFLFYY
jgi:hypothetical protein